MTRRKRLTSLGLAVAVAAPQLAQFGQWHFGVARAASTDSQATPTTEALLKQGITQYDNGQYEDAVTTLQEVDPKSLSDSERGTLVDTLAKADAAAKDRKSARAELQKGEDARKAGRMVEAEQYYQTVLSNNRADPMTRAKAQQELSLVQQAQSVAQSDAKVIYDRGREEYKKGDWIHARADFNKAQQLGYTGGFLEASPAEYLQKIDDGEKKYMEDHAQADAARKEEQRKEQAHASYERGQDEYRSGDWRSARKDFVVARDLGFQPGFLQGLSPAEYLSRMDEKEAQDKAALAQQQQAAKSAAVAAVPVPAPSAPANNAPSNTTVAAASGTSTSSSPMVDYAGTTQTTSGGESDQQTLERRAQLDKIAAQQHVFKAQQLTDAGAKAEAAGNDQDALKDYSQAVEEDPTNAAAVQGRDRELSKTGRIPAAAGGGGILSERQRQINQIVSAINFKFDRAVRDTRTALAANDFTAANNDIADAQNARDEDPTVFTEEDLRRMDATIGGLKGELAQDQRAFSEQARERAAREIATANADRLAAEARERQATIASLIKLSRSEIQQQNYQAAIGVLDQILRLDPQNDYALGVRQLVEDKAIIRDQRHTREVFDSNFNRSLDTAQEAQIPYDDILTYPENWPDLSEMRDTEAKNSDASKEDQETQALLDRRLPQMQFNATALSDAIDFLHDTTGANILVKWKELEAASIDKSTPITASLRDVKFSKVLDIVLDQAGAGKLAYTIDDGVIEISTTDDLNKSVVLKVYDVRDLLMQPTFTLTANAGGGGGGSAPIDSTQNLHLLETKISNLVAPTTWQLKDPNAFGTIDDFQSQMLITQTNDVHQKIAEFLAQLREDRTIQITIDCRFLTIERNFLDDVGVDFGLTLNAASPNHWSPIAISSQTSAFTTLPTNPAVPGSISNEPPGLGITNTVGGPISYGNFLDDVQVGLLLTAVQASQRSSIVHAPRVTFQDGQGATMLQQTNQSYVSNETSTSSLTAGTTTTASISTATDGVTLSIPQAVVSADHKYVTMDLNPSLQNLIAIIPFTTQTATVPTAASTGNGVSVITAQSIIPPTTVIQEPITQTTSVATRVTVPDGGTILLGGVTIAAEVDREAGVPILSKIPFLKRLTTNTSMAKDELVLVILVKPTIVLDKEIQAKQFPLLSTRSAE